MHNSNDLIEKIKSGHLSWSDYSNILRLKPKEIMPFLELAFKLKIENFGNQIKIYVPNRKFPAISITGSECALNCEHCNKKYLKGMKQILKNRDLESFLIELSRNHGVGALISGGSELDGSVPLLNFIQ